MSKHRLLREKTGLLLVDFQERLCAAMDQEEMQWVLNNARRLAEGAQALGLPIWVTEQYPKGLGRTVPFLSDAFPAGLVPHEKVEFSCANVPSVMDAIKESGRTQLLVAGLETHICVFQTARDMAEAGFEVFVAADAVLSRSEQNDSLGLHLIETSGAVVSSTEIALFDMLQKAGTPEFKQISALIK